MGAVEVRYSRILWTTDILWARLGDDKAIPAAPAVTANVKVTEFFITEKVGFRLINREKLKIDALAGFRYWYFGQNLQFSPSSLGLTFTGSQNWVAPLVGGRIQMPLSRKVVVNILGDVGGWGVGSQLEYQVV
jgi:hypothetical protein